MGARRAVFCTVGTDHHPFQRLVDWVDGWAERHPDVEVLIQHGTARAPRSATGAVSLALDELLARMRTADVIVAQAGPGGIAESRAFGKRPIVVPRDPALGEHVDGHQMRFADHMHRHERIVMATTRDELDAALSRALDEPESFRVHDESSSTLATARVIDDALGELVSARRSARRSRR